MRDLACRLSDDFSQLKTTKGSKHLKFTDEWNLKQATCWSGIQVHWIPTSNSEQELGLKTAKYVDSCCGSVGRDLRFGSSHRQILFTTYCIEKTEITKKSPNFKKRLKLLCKVP